VALRSLADLEPAALRSTPDDAWQESLDRTPMVLDHCRIQSISRTAKLCFRKHWIRLSNQALTTP
jgi:hypothetical protein